MNAISDVTHPLLLAASLAQDGALDVSPRLTVTAAIAFLLAVGAIASVWWASRRMRAALKRPAGQARPEEPSELLTPGLYRALRERGIASPEALAAMSPRERQLLLDAARHMTPVMPMLAVGAGGAAAAAGARPPRAERASAEHVLQQQQQHPPTAAVTKSHSVSGLHCPACGTRIDGWTAATANMLARCSSCARRLAIRADGTRLIVSADVAPEA